MWKVLGHGSLEKLEDNLWCVDGELPRMTLRRRMSAIRLSDGRLMVHSPIALAADAMAELEAFGEVAFIVVPNGYHRMDAPAYAERYPQARVLCPAPSRARVEQVVTVHGDVSELPADAALAVEPLAENKAGEVALRVTHVDGGVTLIFNDAIFNQPHMPGFGGLVMRLLGSTGGPRITRIGRMMLVRDARAFADALRRLAATEGLRRLVVSHGEHVESDAAGVLRSVADRLHPV